MAPCSGAWRLHVPRGPVDIPTQVRNAGAVPVGAVDLAAGGWTDHVEMRGGGSWVVANLNLGHSPVVVDGSDCIPASNGALTAVG